jgi:uncharacterized membrane protein HdeD (DUF308 family)
MAGIILLLFGIIYLLKGSFMSYHSQAISLLWSELDREMQYLLLAMMRVMAGGYLSTGILIVLAQFLFNRHQNKNWPLIILVCGSVVSITSLYATILVRQHTPGQPPTFVAILGLILLITGFIFNRLSSVKNPNHNKHEK